ncbi:DUF6233 domain-containing protein [Streptomyces niveus]
MSPGDQAAPVPALVRVLLPDGQELTARLWSRRQLPDGWVYLVGLPVYSNGPDGAVEASEYRVWVRAPEHVRPVAGISYDGVPTERLPPPPPVREALGPRRQSGWVTVSAGGSRGAGSRTVLHARDCAEAPPPVHVLSLEEALDLAERPATRLCERRGTGTGAPAARVRPHRNCLTTGAVRRRRPVPPVTKATARPTSSLFG